MAERKTETRMNARDPVHLPSCRMNKKLGRGAEGSAGVGGGVGGSGEGGGVGAGCGGVGPPPGKMPQVNPFAP